MTAVAERPTLVIERGSSCPLCGFLPAARTPHGWSSGMGTHVHRKHGLTHVGETRDCQHRNVRHEHGTPQAYTSDGCRCAACIEANRSSKAAGRRERAYGRFDRHLVPAGPTKRRIRELRMAGTPANVIAKRAGLSTTTLREITNGRTINGRHRPTIRVYASTEAAVLGVKPATKHIHAKFTPAIGSTRRLQALTTLGYSGDELARRLGIAESNLRPILHGKRKFVQHSTAETVRALYDELWDKPYVPTSAAHKSGLGRTRDIASRRGYAPPLAWDDDTIDDPDATPDLGCESDGTTAQVEDLDFLARLGVDPIEASRRIGRGRHTLRSAATRHGRSDLALYIIRGA